MSGLWLQLHWASLISTGLRVGGERGCGWLCRRRSTIVPTLLIILFSFFVSCAQKDFVHIIAFHIFPALLTTALATTHRAALGSEGAGRGSLEDTVVIRSPQVSCLLFISASISCCFFFLFRFFLHSLHFYFWITFKQYARRCPLFPCFEHCFSSAWVLELLR